MTNLSDHLFEYLVKKIPGFNRVKKSGKLIFTCPNVKKHKFEPNGMWAEFLPNSDKIACGLCDFRGTVYDCVRVLEEDKRNWSDAEITNFLIGDLNLDLYKELSEYEKYNWSLVPLLKNSKNPFEKDWRDSEKKDKTQWIKWLNNNLNIGLNCEKSNVLAVDVDCKKMVPVESQQLREEIINLCETSQTLKQITPSGGRHYIFIWDEQLRKQIVNGCNTQIDTRTEGQIVIAPSHIDGKSYEWSNLGVIIQTIPEELKSKLLQFQTVEKGRSTSEINQDLSDSVVAKPSLLNNGLEGCRNDSFVQLGGLLTKLEVQEDKKATILHWLNKNWLEKPLDIREIQAMLGSLAGYSLDNEKGHEKMIYEYMKLVQTDISARDIIDAIKLPRSIVDKYLSQFVKEGKAVRMGRGRYQYKEKIEWSDNAPEMVEEYKYKIPFFNNIAVFQDRDVLLLGARTNDGKTTIALNILREVIEQGIKPYYIYSEAGSRFQKTSQLLGITGKYFHTYHENPLAIELEPNAFNIIDWLHLEHKENTDTVLKHLNNELQRKGGILVVFTQLKQNYEFFAPNMIDHYPTFAARYIQDNDNHTEGHFDIQKIKEPRGNFTSYSLQCIYDHTTKIFKVKELL